MGRSAMTAIDDTMSPKGDDRADTQAQGAAAGGQTGFRRNRARSRHRPEGEAAHIPGSQSGSRSVTILIPLPFSNANLSWQSGRLYLIHGSMYPKTDTLVLPPVLSGVPRNSMTYCLVEL